MINHGPIQSGSSDQWSGLDDLITNSNQFKQLLFCDPLGNRGFMQHKYGILFTYDRKTVIVTDYGNYTFNPEKWAFVNVDTDEVVPILISLDAVSQGHHAFSDPMANITIVENVQEHLFKTILAIKKLVVDYAIHDSITLHHSATTSGEMTELIKKLTKSMEKSLYEPIPTIQDYAN